MDNMLFVKVSFFAPQSGYLPVATSDPEQARVMATQMLEGVMELVIFDVLTEEQVKLDMMNTVAEDAPSSTTIN